MFAVPFSYVLEVRLWRPSECGSLEVGILGKSKKTSWGSAFEGRENSGVLGDGVCPYSRQGD